MKKLKDKIRFAFISPRKFIIKYLTLIGKYFLHNKNPRVLVVVNHYYGKGNEFNGKSATQEIGVRRRIVESVIAELHTIQNVDIVVCGIKGKSLIKIDKDFSYIIDPSFLVYESIEWMASQIDKYDYFINIEDDILLTNETFKRVVEFDKKSPVKHCFHPNRMEFKNGKEYCVDLVAMPGWIENTIRYKEHELKVARNPHSGIAIFSKEKMKYAIQHTNLKKREKIIGHYMASAYANLHAPFLMFRSFNPLNYHKVIHLDNWEPK